MLHGSYNYGLVVLSIALAIVAAYAALDFAGRVTVAQRRSRGMWLAGGATSMGLGIWAMHYIGMLAFHLPVSILYHYPTVVVSLLAAIVASAVALFTVGRERMSRVSLWAGALVMGSGIAAMHYIGMAAMRLPAMMEYRWLPVALSVGFAVAISWVALILAFQIRHEKKTSQRKLLSALVMGSAISLMHYTGMWAVRFYASDIPFSVRDTVRISSLGIVVISVTSFLVMSLAIATAYLDRMLTMQTATVNTARDGEARLRMLAEAIPQIVWTATPDGAVDYCNQRWYQLTGFSEEQTVGAGWSNAMHPDDRPVAEQNWKKVLGAGDSFEMDYRVRSAAGNFIWHLVRATPMRDSTGAIVKWFGSCTDIDDQMRYQAVLEEQIKQHTAALMDANIRLQWEMQERALAQEELNLQNECMVRDLTRRSNRSTNLAKTAEMLQSCEAVTDASSVVGGMASKVFPELRGALLLFSASREILEVAVTWTDCEPPAKTFAPQDCWALRTGRPHIVMAGDHSAECKHASGRYSYCCLPLLANGEAVGILHFQMLEAGALPPQILFVANMFAEQFSLSVANIRLREALRSQSIRDPLTGLYNRRYLEEVMARLTRRTARAKQSLGILMLDLDHFKNFNDTCGHDAGDAVLRETASFLLRNVRAEDIVCRFGGEEFVVILPMAGLNATQARAESIRSRLRELLVIHQGRSLGTITVSIGVAGLPQHGTAPKELLAAADAALYRAKREGRDRVMVADSLVTAGVELT